MAIKKITALALCICMIIPFTVMFSSAEGVTNVFTSTGLLKDCFYSDGKKTSFPGYSSSAFIAISGGKTLYAGIISPSQAQNVPVFEFYDAAKKYISDAGIKSVTIDKYSKNYGVASIKAPENAKFVRVNLETVHAEHFMLTVDEKFTAEEYFTISGDEKPLVRFDSPLYGKSILFCGDSICDAAVEKNDPERKQIAGWAGRIGVYNDMEWKNAGKSGASIALTNGRARVLDQLKSNAPLASRYEIVLLHGGTNDGWDNLPVGKISDSTNPDDFDIKTFAGGLEYLFWYAKTTYKKAKIGYIINAKTPTYLGSLHDMNKYYNLAKQICEKWEVPYVDLYNAPELKGVTIPTCNGDQIHPTAEGYDIITPLIQAFAESLVAEPIVTETPKTSEAPETTAAPETKTTEAPMTSPCELPTAEPTSTPESNGLSTGVIIAIAAVFAVAICSAIVIPVISRKKKK